MGVLPDAPPRFFREERFFRTPEKMGPSSGEEGRRVLPPPAPSCSLAPLAGPVLVAAPRSEPALAAARLSGLVHSARGVGKIPAAAASGAAAKSRSNRGESGSSAGGSPPSGEALPSGGKEAACRGARLSPPSTGQLLALPGAPSAPPCLSLAPHSAPPHSPRTPFPASPPSSSSSSSPRRFASRFITSPGPRRGAPRGRHRLLLLGPRGSHRRSHLGPLRLGRVRRREGCGVGTGGRWGGLGRPPPPHLAVQVGHPQQRAEEEGAGAAGGRAGGRGRGPRGAAGARPSPGRAHAPAASGPHSLQLRPRGRPLPPLWQRVRPAPAHARHLRRLGCSSRRRAWRGEIGRASCRERVSSPV